MSIIGSLWSIAWRNPYDPPPSGLEVLARIFVPGHNTRPPEELKAIKYSLGGGYGVTWCAMTEPMRQRSPEVLANMRRKRLSRRMNAKAPLFADFFIEQELARKPEYYAGVTDAYLEAQRQEALDADRQLFEMPLAHPNELIVFGDEPPECKVRAERLRADIERSIAAAHFKRTANAK
ncbi:MAG: hypothetical protein HY741_05145 [Chloroflexi bacterium]|nr:hypothetical protein [Chloroflexota bacterium]